MILGAIIGLGVDEKALIAEISKLKISGFKISFSQVDRSGINAVKANVEIPHEHAHRHLRHIEKIINDSALSENVKTRAIKIFTHLAEAEAKVHGVEIEKIHFHEVGAMDAIIDIVGACVGFEMLGIEKFACSKIHVGSGFVKMAHGKFPVPPPAVAELLKEIPIYSTEIEGELITPTGAAIISTVCEEFGKIPGMRVSQTAYGAGTREYKDFPNAVRLMLGETFQSAEFEIAGNQNDKLSLIQTNIDDISPQILGYLMERVLESEALDCWFTSIQMKKNRPATQVSILCKKSVREKLIDLIYKETTTLGVRVMEVERNCLPREIIRIKTEFGNIDVKVAKKDGKILNAKPEYEQIRAIAVKSKYSMVEIETLIAEEIQKQIGK